MLEVAGSLVDSVVVVAEWRPVEHKIMPVMPQITLNSYCITVNVTTLGV